MSQFLLPCACGRRLAIAASQAGQRLRCECGRELDGPTLRELNRLDRVETQPSSAPAAGWTGRQGLIFLGAAIAALALAAFAWLEIRHPPSRESAMPKTNVDLLTPAQAWAYWEVFALGIEHPPGAVQGCAAGPRSSRAR